MKFSHYLILAMAASMPLAVSAEHLKSLNGAGVSKDIPASADFYRHVNKAWMDANPLTPEYSRYGQFNILTDSSNNRIRRIVTGMGQTNPAPGTNAYKIAALYQTGMDSVRLNREGAAPVRNDLARIEKASPAEMEDVFIWLQKSYAAPFIGAGIQEDLADSHRYAMYLGSGGMTLGDRDYYLKNDKDNKEIRKAYVKMIETQMMLCGYSRKDAKRIAKNVLKVETLMADSALTREQSRDMQAMNNPRNRKQLAEMYPDFPWDRFFVETMNIDPEMVIVTELKPIAQANRLYKNLSVREKKDYYLWQYLRQATPYLSDDFADASFEFAKVMSGVEQQRPRWKKVLATTEDALGEAIGEIYVKEYFPESSKQYMIGLIENLRKALGKHIINLSWMTDDTKVEAMKKLNAIDVKVGYPDKFRDYSTMEIDPALSYYENVHNAQMWEQNRRLAKWGKPVDRSEWLMTPQTINAYYNPTSNEIVFPAGILQAPFFDPEASDAENYGGIGVVIGHELTHGFDDQGCQFDADGNMVNWWTKEDAEAFKNLTNGLVEQYSEVEVLPGLHANGQYTLGENIADHGGLRIARTAFLDSQKKKGVDVTSEDARIDGFDPMQVFYMNYANLWAQNVRDAEIRSLTMGDVHSLGENRVNVALRNLTPFFEAFGIKEGDKMFRPENERLIIW